MAIVKGYGVAAKRRLLVAELKRDGAPSSPPAHRKGHQAKRREQGGVARAGDTQFAPGSRVDATAAKHLRKDKAYYPGYVEPLKAKGVRYMQTVLTHYGGWHSGTTGDDGFLSHVCHSGGRRVPHGVGGEIRAPHEDVGVRHA